MATKTYLRCGDVLRPCKIMETSDQLVARGTFHKVILLDVSEPGASATWQAADRVVHATEERSLCACGFRVGMTDNEGQRRCLGCGKVHSGGAQ